MQVRKQQLELDMEQQTGSKLGKECQGYILSPYLFNIFFFLKEQMNFILFIFDE